MREIELNTGHKLICDENNYFTIPNIELACGFLFRQFVRNKYTAELCDKITLAGQSPFAKKSAEFEAKAHPLLAIFCLNRRCKGFDLVKNPVLVDILKESLLSASDSSINVCAGALFFNHNRKQKIDKVIKDLPQLEASQYAHLADLAYSLQSANIALALFQKGY